MTSYLITCQGRFSRGAIVKLGEMGIAAREAEPGTSEGAGYQLLVEAGSAEDAILRAKGAVAVVGATAHGYQVSAERTT